MTVTLDPTNTPCGEEASLEADGCILDDLRAFVCRFVAFPESTHADAVTLWIAHTWAFDAAEATPRLSIQSAEKQSGKTRLLELLDLLVRSSLSVASISAAAMFRLIADGPTTLLIDEADTVFDGRGSGAEDLRGVLNAGYRRGGGVMRAAGKGTGVQRFPVFAPVALAGIGRLPDTVQDRSIVIRLKRRGLSEPVEKLRRREVEPDALALCLVMSRWAEENLPALAARRPIMPEPLGDRAADIWEPLLAIAAHAGGDWPKRAATAAIALSAPVDGDDGSDNVRLLADIRHAFDRLQRERVSSVDLVRALVALEDAPWGETPQIDTRALARMLRPFDVRPRLVRVGETVLRGYIQADFADPFGRYLPLSEASK